MEPLKYIILKKKRFTVTFVGDLRKVILKQTPPLYKRRIGHAENLINAAAFNRLNTVGPSKPRIPGSLGRTDAEKVNCSHHYNGNFFCLATLGASLAQQYSGFVPRELLEKSSEPGNLQPNMAVIHLTTFELNIN